MNEALEIPRPDAPPTRVWAPNFEEHRVGNSSECMCYLVSYLPGLRLDVKMCKVPLYASVRMCKRPLYASVRMYKIPPYASNSRRYTSSSVVSAPHSNAKRTDLFWVYWYVGGAGGEALRTRVYSIKGLRIMFAFANEKSQEGIEDDVQHY